MTRLIASGISLGLSSASVLGGTKERTSNRPWMPFAPEDIPQVTVRWEDPGQKEVFVVEGEEYQCRVATHPARVLSLRVGEEDLLGPDGIECGLTDADGEEYTVAPRDVTPDWDVWIGQGYKLAPSSRARMNVWNASPYYWDCHLLDIPFISRKGLHLIESTQSAPPLKEWTFDRGPREWQTNASTEFVDGQTGRLAVEMTGPDPFIWSGEFRGPSGSLEIGFRTRGKGGGAAIYWYCDGDAGFAGDKVQTFSVREGKEWHEAKVRIETATSLRAIRFDPPGESGRIEIDHISIRQAQPREVNAALPMRGELVFHAFADRMHIELRLDPADGQPTPTTAVWRVDAADTRTFSQEERPIVTLPGEPGGAILGTRGSSFDTTNGSWRTPLTGLRPGAYWVFRPVGGRKAATAFNTELHPLASGSVATEDGRWAGYDPVSGLYKMATTVNTGAFGFEAAYKVPTRRMATGVQLRNDALPRNIVVKCATGVGNLPGSLLADPDGFPLPVPVLVAKNFGGEMEEPDDTAYGDAYFPLHLKPNDQRDFQVIHVLQTWGNHMVKQVSSIRFFMIYWHLSVGLSESTCFTHDFQGGDFSYRIPDFRPLSGAFYPGQPQHGVGQFPGFLQYQTNSSTRLIYERTIFESTSPCLARFTMEFHSSDDAATGRVAVMEAPHDDEMRTFLHMRYDWNQEMKIEGDARRNFRWLNMFDRFRSSDLVWTANDGSIQIMPLTGESTPVLLGEMLAQDSPFINTNADCVGEQYNCVTLVRNYRAKLGGKERDQVAMSADFQEPYEFWLTVPEEQLALQPGDFIEADVMLMPHGEPTLPDLKAARERERFGAGRIKVDAKVGEVLDTYPVRVRAEDEVAHFTLEGAFDQTPLIVEGFKGWKVPLLWWNGMWQDQQVHGGDGYQVEPDGQGGYRFVFVYPIRKGQKLDLLVTRADCSTGISRMSDRNGELLLESETEGDFHLKTPRLFAPGRNVWHAERGLAEFTGRGRRVESVPISFESCDHGAVVEILEHSADAAKVRTEGGPMALRFSGLAQGAVYVVDVNGSRSERTARAGGSITVKTTGATATVSLYLNLPR